MEGTGRDWYDDERPSPPTLILANSSSDDNDDETDVTEKDNGSSLVIGTTSLLPTHNTRFQLNLCHGIKGPQVARENLTIAQDQYQKLFQRKISDKAVHSTSSKLHDARHRCRGNNTLRRQAAELVTQHPEYSSLSSDMRESVIERQDDIVTEHPNASTRYDMRRFDVRMATYINNPIPWIVKTPSPEQLARVGLYYTGMEDRVCCFSCNIELEEWSEDDEPLLKHYVACPHCLFLHQDFSDQLKSLKHQLTTSSTHQAQGYSNTSRRLHSFAQWPYSHIVTSYQLASVGFYYTGEGTKVICFSCGLTVRDWKRGDIPLLVHCRTNPDCQFIKSIIKGAPSSEPTVPTPILKTLTAADSTAATNRPNFNDFQIRLKSFKKLSPAFPVLREQLAEAGLYLLRLPDVMKCFKCSCVLQGWVEGDTAIEKHRGASPHCTYLTEKFPSKLSASPEVDLNDLPAPQYNEHQLEMMARQHQQQPSSSQPSTLSAEALPFHRLSISQNSSSGSSGYHTMSQPPSYSTERTPYSETNTSLIPSSTEHTTSQSSSNPTHDVESPPDHPNSYSLTGNSLSTSDINKSVSLPAAMSHSMTSDLTPPLQSTASAISHQQPTSLPSGAECVVCMDRPLEMVFVPCGHICVCEECSHQVVRCPICRARTEMAVKVYFPY